MRILRLSLFLIPLLHLGCSSKQSSTASVPLAKSELFTYEGTLELPTKQRFDVHLFVELKVPAISTESQVFKSFHPAGETPEQEKDLYSCGVQIKFASIGTATLKLKGLTPQSPSKEWTTPLYVDLSLAQMSDAKSKCVFQLPRTAPVELRQIQKVLIPLNKQQGFSIYPFAHFERALATGRLQAEKDRFYIIDLPFDEFRSSKTTAVGSNDLMWVVEQKGRITRIETGFIPLKPVD